MSKILRHEPEHAGITLDKNGFVDVVTLIEKLSIPQGKDGLDWIIETNNKKRFEYNLDQTKVRACQGHSVEVDSEVKLVIPPEKLYHGTALDTVKQILKDGLKPMSRIHVHLSKDKETAIKVGKRKSEDIRILSIDAKKAHDDGIEFFVSSNDVYLSKFVPSEFIRTNGHIS